MTILPELDARIRAAVEAVAATDPNPTDPFRGLYISDDQARGLAFQDSDEELGARLVETADRLGLTVLERDALALAAAPELSPRYGRLFAYLHDDVTRKSASPRLVARLLAGPDLPFETALACFAREGALRRSGAVRLIEDASPGPLADRLVGVPDRLAAHLLGSRLDDQAGEAHLERVDPDAATDTELDDEAVLALRRLLAAQTHLPVLVTGPDAALLLARALGRGLLLVQAEAALDSQARGDAELAARLEGRTVCVHGLDRLDPEQRGRLAHTGAGSHRALLCARSRESAIGLESTGVSVVESKLPTYGERVAAWGTLAAAEAVGAVAAKFRLSRAQIATASELARVHARGRGSRSVDSADLHAGARQASSTVLGELADRVSVAYGWSDLVLPARQLELLRSISAYLRHRDLVLSEWGYERTVGGSQGIKALFAGESGTGKTMSAQVLAADLGLELFRIDLATVVSKYIGETEKNLDRIFDAAEGSNAILVFDEADALFGKRSEVTDSHDRYANIEVAYLLQKMEAYEGAVVLATNLRRNIDEAFLRRLDFVIDFPFPEPEDRLKIWRLMLPDRAPVADDLDLPLLAYQFKLSGGGIRNCSVAAAFLAADDGGVITMSHLVRAVAVEYGKLGRLTLGAEFDAVAGPVGGNGPS